MPNNAIETLDSRIEECRDRIQRLLIRLDLFRDGGLEDQTYLRQQRHDAQTLVGLAQTLDLPLIAALGQKLQEAISLGLTDPESGNRLRRFLDHLNQTLDRPQPESPAALKQALLESPDPLGRLDDLEAELSRPVATMLLITSARVVAQGLRSVLRACGYQALVTDNPFEGLWLACQSAPAGVIAASQLEGISGVDVLRALSVMTPTASLPMALISSFDRTHPALQGLPPRAALLRLGASLNQDLGEFLSGPSLPMR